MGPVEKSLLLHLKAVALQGEQANSSSFYTIIWQVDMLWFEYFVVKD